MSQETKKAPAPAGKQQQAAATAEASKTIVLIGGDKGGVGKSTCARTLAEYLKAKGVSFRAYDGDDTNPTFLRYWQEAHRLSTKTTKGFEPLVNNIESPEPVQLVDLGAGTSIIFGQFADKADFFGLVGDNGVRVTLVFLLVPSADSIGLLKTIAEQYGDKLAYVIVRNNAVSGSWDLWEQSKTRTALQALGAEELTMPALDAEAFSACDKNSLTWSAAQTSTALTLVGRSYVKRWFRAMSEEFDRVQDRLF